MKIVENIGLRALRMFDPETAHGLSIQALNAGLGPKTGPFTSDRLRTTVAGLDLPNPLNLSPSLTRVPSLTLMQST